MKFPSFKFNKVSIGKLIVFNTYRILLVIILVAIVYFSLFFNQYFIQTVIIPAEIPETDIIARQIKVDLNLFQSILNDYSEKTSGEVADFGDVRNPFQE